MRILSENDIDVAVVSLPLMLDEAVFERAGNGAGVIVYSSFEVAMLKTNSKIRRGVGCSDSLEEAVRLLDLSKAR